MTKNDLIFISNLGTVFANYYIPACRVSSFDDLRRFPLREVLLSDPRRCPRFRRQRARRPIRSSLHRSHTCPRSGTVRCLLSSVQESLRSRQRVGRACDASRKGLSANSPRNVSLSTPAATPDRIETRQASLAHKPAY